MTNNATPFPHNTNNNRKDHPMLDQFSLKGRTALITGSGQNIGKACALLFAKAGANVVVNGLRNKASVDGTVAEIEAGGGKAIGIMGDVGDPDFVESMVAKAHDTFGSVDIAISNVSIRKKQQFLEISVEDWRRTMNSNLNSCFYLARSVIPRMQEKKWGRIIHMSGVDGFSVHMTTRAHNIVAKSGMHALARALALEFGPFGITVNTVAPGAIQTTRDFSQYPDNFEQRAIASIPLGRIGKVEDIANGCLYLCSEAGGFVTGAVLHINGGAHRFS